MKQRDIYWADLNSTKGSEQKGVRPIVNVSGIDPIAQIKTFGYL